MLKERVELFDRHCYGRVLLLSVSFEFDGLSLRLRVFGELI